MNSASSAWNAEAQTYGRFWIDVPGEDRRRKTIALGVCPTKTVAKRKLREYVEASGVNDEQTFIESTSSALTFEKQAKIWLDGVKNRKRRPVKPATLKGWQSCLDKWLVPILGARSVAEVGNAALKMLIEKLSAAGLAPKSIVNYTQVVKLVVASVVNAEGEQVYPRKWNHEFVGLPIVDKENQNRPTLTAEEITTVLEKCNDRYRTLFTVLAGTGLRIGEALGLKITDLANDCRTINVQRSIFQGREQQPKTANAVRSIDIPESLAEMLRKFTAGRDGYVFPTKNKRPLSQRNVLRMLNSKVENATLHSFRRFRTAWLRKAQVPEDLIQYWLGHAESSVTDLYARQLRKDVKYRLDWAEKCGLGFELGYVGLQNEEAAPVKVAA
jgi:integrase